MIIQAAIFLVQFAFWAGAYYTFAKQTRKDTDGIGVKVRQVERDLLDKNQQLNRKMERRNKQLLAALILSGHTDEDVERFTHLLRDDSWDQP